MLGSGLKAARGDSNPSIAVIANERQTPMLSKRHENIAEH
jgi:hypothetical protein